jgi:hypothetical protein
MTAIIPLIVIDSFAQDIAARRYCIGGLERIHDV